jgi:hypothetical protein
LGSAEAFPSLLCLRPLISYYWVLSGNNLYTSSTLWNVGIGTNNPQAKLEVRGYSMITQLGVGGNLNAPSYPLGMYRLSVSGDSYFTGDTIIRGKVGIGSGFAQPQADLHVGGVMYLAPTSAPSTPLEGMMYYDKGEGKFKCYQKDQNGILSWQTCGGGTAGETPFPSPFPSPFPFRVYNQGRLVLEINEE